MRFKWRKIRHIQVKTTKKSNQIKGNSIMRKILITAAVLLISAPAFAQDFSVSARGGMNMCMDNGDAKCDDVSGSYSLTLAPTYHVLPDIAVSLDINVSDFSYDKVKPDSSMIMHVMPVVHFFVPAGPVKLSAGLGLGYSRMSAKTGSVEVSASTFIAMKAVLGVAYPLDEKMSVGVAFDYIRSGEVNSCSKVGGGENCANVDAASQLQAGVSFSYAF
jgi:hypothetical protein